MPSQKPSGYWNDFANLEREVREFVDEHGPPGVMPTEQKLRAANRINLRNAIQKHGGFVEVARRLGLERSQRYAARDSQDTPLQPAPPAPTPARPAQLPLRAAGDEALAPPAAPAYAVPAPAPVVPAEPERGAADYWEVFANVERELRAFVGEQRADGAMPTIPDLEAAGREELADAVLQHGGYRTVAERVGLPHRLGAKRAAPPASAPPTSEPTPVPPSRFRNDRPDGRPIDRPESRGADRPDRSEGRGIDRPSSAFPPRRPKF